MVVHYPRERLRYNSERPTAISDVLLATGPGSYRSGDIALGTPTTSARTRRGLWALYPVGEEVLVTHPGGAIAGPPHQVAAALDRLAAVDGHDQLERQVVQTLRDFLVDDPPEAVAGVRRWSRPAVGYRLSGPRNQPGQQLDQARSQPARPLPLRDGRVRPTPPKVAPEPALRPAA
jgi:hypothetical protein